MGRPLLEREHELAELAAAARDARGGDGSVVLVVGEAGIGKSSVVEALRSVLPAEGRLLVGYCDDLATPRVLGPLWDLVGSVGAGLGQALGAGDRGRVIDALRSELDWPDHPTVLVIEDVHWADDATIDVLSVLVRRIAALPVVLVLTYRDNELDRDHPLRPLLGLASGTNRLRRLPLARLSVDAVRRLGGPSGLDPEQVFAITAGNPFFVAEVLASGQLGTVPPTIALAAWSRLRDLDGPTRDALEQLAVVPSAVERWLVDAIVHDGLSGLARAEQRGVLTITPTRVLFRHELIRRAIVDAMLTGRRVACNQRVLSALLARPGVDLSRLLHHAAEVGSDDIIVQYGPAAARSAVQAQSHRQAVAYFQLLLARPADAYPPAERAALLQEYAIECYTLGLADLAVRAQVDAVAVRRAVGAPLGLGDALRWLSRIRWWAGDRAEADAAGAEAIVVLEPADEPAALAHALSNQSQLHALAGRDADGIHFAERAVAMAQRIDDPGLLSHALNNLGTLHWHQGDLGGRELVERSLAVAVAAGEVHHVLRAYVNLTWTLIEDLEFGQADDFLTEAIEVADDAEYLGFLRYLHVERGLIHLARGEWDEADREARWAVEAAAPMRCPSLFVLGRTRIRRGLPGGDELLDQSWALAQELDEVQRIGPVAGGMAEAAFLRDDPAGIIAVVGPVYERVRRYGYGCYPAELGYWLGRAGHPVPMDDSGHPYALQAAGRWREAAQAWERAGSPYEQAAALAQSPEPADRLTALSILDSIGAEPLARRVRAGLRELGVTRVPRGPAPSTRDNPAGLTGRQVEVVRLLADGLTNAEIAARLVLSVRTVDTHVSAALDKLQVHTRRDATVRARALGLLVSP